MICAFKKHFLNAVKRTLLTYVIGTVLISIVGVIPILPSVNDSDNSELCYFQNYHPLAERMQPQNWGITFDTHGFLYAANQSGVLEYDGVNWRFIDIPNITVRSIATDKDGIIYVGGNNEFGFLQPDSTGLLKFVSLSQSLGDDRKNFGNVWGVYPLKDSIYFHTLTGLFRWNCKHKIVDILTPQTQFSAVLCCRESLYIRQQGIGLMKMDKGKPVLIPSGEIFADIPVKMMVPYLTNSGNILIGTRSHGLFIYDGQEIHPFKTEVDTFLKTNFLTNGILLNPGTTNLNTCEFALATMRGGIVIITESGKLKRRFSTDTGLPDNTVWYAREDSQGNIWLALNKGISKIEYSSPLSYYDEEHSGLPGIVVSLACPKTNEIYAGTTYGLFIKSPGKRFLPVPGITGVCWWLLTLKDSIMAATGDGIFQVKQKKVIKLSNQKAFALSHSQLDPNRIWVVTGEGIISLYSKQNNWQREYSINTIPVDARTLVEEKNGRIWLGCLSNGILKIDFPSAETIKKPEISYYNGTCGLPKGEVHIFYAAQHVIFATVNGLYRYDEAKNFFFPDNLLGPAFIGSSTGHQVFRLAQDRNNHIWFHSLRRNFHALPQPDGTYLIEKTPFLRIPNLQVNQIYPCPKGNIIWFATHNGLLRFNPSKKKEYRHNFSAYVRQVWINSQSTALPLPDLPFGKTNLRIQFSAPFFESEDRTTYSYKLDGYDSNWSHWSNETQKDYTNLDAGTYTFHVRAKNIYNHISKEDTVGFTVLSPWYNTWWAYFLYLTGLLIVMLIVVKFRSYKLIKEKKYLEAIIQKRTGELEEKTKQLASQSAQLKEMDKAKSRFFANISHEFRTPLTLIMGPLEQLLNGENSIEKQNTLSLALRNSQRLMILINQLLDLSRLDNGKMQLRAQSQDIISFLKGLIASFHSLLEQKGLNYKFHAEEEELILYFDSEKMEKVIINIIANAVKYTPAGGTITLTSAVNSLETEQFPSGYLEISISDTGLGIPSEHLPHIFDRFFQSNTTQPLEFHNTGTGIGLALVKELVLLHHGDIRVHSRLEVGTTFIIRLPREKHHLKFDEIINNSKSNDPIKNKKDLRDTAEYLVGIPAKTEDEESIDDDYHSSQERDVVLVIEDNPDVRKYIRKPLEKDFTVREAIDGRNGIKMAKEIIPDIIISDVMMPNMDGFQVCDILKKDIETSHIPIILLTAKASEDSIIEGFQIGADDYITKPFNVKILLARIKNLINLRHQLQESIQREMLLQPTKIEISSMDSQFIKELKTAIETHLSDMDLNIDMLANSLYMSKATLNRKVKALTGESTKRFIQSYRLKRAAQLLKNNYGNVTEVAFAVGFSSSNYFTRCFREKFQQLPHSYAE